MAPSVEDQLAAVTAGLVRVGELLLAPSPAALDHCAMLLQTAVTGMSALRDERRNAKGWAHDLAEARMLRKSLGRVRRLLDNANRFHQNWARRRAALSAGYTPGGEPAVVLSGCRLVLNG